MLVFVITLRSRATSRNWELTSQLLRRTMESALRQTDPALRVVVSCQEIPAIGLSDPRIVWVSQPHPSVAPDDFSGQMADKYRKTRAGLEAARAFCPCHIMKLDADDLVSNRLAAWVSRHDCGQGWVVDRGYVFEENARSLMAFRPLHHLCGSTFVVPTTHAALPEPGATPASRLPLLDIAHHELMSALQAQGYRMASIPFPATVYNTGNGQNHSRMSLRNWQAWRLRFRKLVGWRPLTEALRAEFNIRPMLS